MVRDNRKHSPARTRSKRGTNLFSILLTAGGFAVVLGVVYVAASGTGSSQKADEAGRAAHADQSATASDEPRSTESPEPDAANRPAGRLQAPAETRSQPIAHAASGSPTAGSLPSSQPLAVSVPQPAEDDPAEARLKRVQGHLAAGEFGPALELAEAAADAGERSVLLKLVVEAQIEAGEFDAAKASLSHVPLRRERAQAWQEYALRKPMAAGGGMADFTWLMDIIQKETSGPWFAEAGEGGTITPTASWLSGVSVDPHGLLSRLTKEEQTGRLKALGLRARKADLNDDMARPSEMRLVSLTRLEREIARCLAERRPVPTTMQYLAGLTRVEYIFVYPEEGEIVIGGPAEGWRYDEGGLAVGDASGTPTLQLDDFVTVFRTFSPAGKGEFNCLIVPRQEGLRRVQEYAAESQARGPLRPGAVRRFVSELQDRLGLQDVEVNGVPLDSRVARVIVEADYRMKLIGVDKLDGGPGIPSYFDILPLAQQKNPPPTTALRWWLTMKYAAVLHSPERDAFQIQGSSVQCQCENELIAADGRRIHTGTADATNRLFARNFTQHYDELAKRDPIFADLQNVMDLSLVAALLRHERAGERLGWDGGVFASGGAYRPARFEPPKTVMSVVNHRVYRGRDIVVQVAGGVQGNLMAVAKDAEIRRELPRLSAVARFARASDLPEGRWWWDAEE